MRILLLQRSIILSLFFIPGFLFAQNINHRTELSHCLNPDGKNAREEVEKSEWTEDASARTLKTATFYSNDGQIRIRQSSRPINYYNNANELVPIKATLSANSNGSWSSLEQPFPTYLNSDGSMSLTLVNKIDRLTFGRNTNLNNDRFHNLTVSDNVVSMASGIPGVIKESYFKENSIKYNYVIDQNLNVNAPLVFSEEIELPDGYKLQLDQERGKRTDLGWAGLVNVVNTRSGEIEATFHEPVCFDANNQFMVAAYEINKKENSNYTLKIIVDQSWLNAVDRSYPVVVDPIVTGPTTTWTGGQMPSCFVPSYNADSILVDIPANITITMLNITASFYADPWTGAWMQDGQMFFSTSCNNSQTFTITGAAGQTAGTAYLDYYNIFNPLTCCYTESCSAQTFYLTYNLGRTLWGSGCNTTYIRYDPVTTSWPFEAEIVGNTAEAYGAQWNVPSAAICANKCDINGIAYAYYGVAPYTFTHPWSTDTIVQGVNIGCGNGSTTAIFDLTIPNCPVYCDTVNTTLIIPPPTIIDACGNVVTGIPADNIPLKPVPQMNPFYDTLVCSGEPVLIDLTPCIPQANVTWIDIWDVHTTNLIDTTIINTSGNAIVKNYTAYATYNNCTSDTLHLPLYIEPNPQAAYTTNPDPLIVSVEAQFTDGTNFNNANGISWFYSFGDGDLSFDQNPNHTYFVPGDYQICLQVVDDNGCSDSICLIVPVAPAELVMPNVVTANNDEVNDLLEFKYLEFYPNNHLTVMNRWGNVVYDKDGYLNDWNPSDLTEGIYFYILELKDKEKNYEGFFHLVK